jgi:hypothetical protein
VLADWSDAGFAMLTLDGTSDPLGVNIGADTTDANILNGYSIITDPANLGTPDWNLEVVMGFDSADDFYQVAITDAAIAALANLRGTGSNNTANAFGTFSGGLSVLYDLDLPPLLSVEATDQFGVTSLHDVSITSGALTDVRSSRRDDEDGEWMWADNADFGINATPEPASMLAWAGLGGIGMLVSRYRRRRQAAK